MTRSRMDYQTWRFIDHQEGVVFVDNLQRQRFCPRAGRAWWRDIYRDDVPYPNAIPGCHRSGGNTDLPLLDQPLQLTPRQCRQMRREVFVETHAAVVSAHLQPKMLRSHAWSTSVFGSAEG